ncbi:hypothetical protein JL722_3958 [Aureococcus anophagefferens]|nr:hypothetical protein JL722_3958 [Aureococcus anophagefferens]
MSTRRALLRVAAELYNLEQSSTELKAELKELYFLSAKEVEVGGGKKAIIVFVPFGLLKSYHKIQTRLVRELEKKFSGRHVIIVAQRTILGKNYARSSSSSVCLDPKDQVNVETKLDRSPRGTKLTNKASSSSSRHRTLAGPWARPSPTAAVPLAAAAAHLRERPGAPCASGRSAAAPATLGRGAEKAGRAIGRPDGRAAT